MSPNQRINLMANLWPAACAAQGWNKSDRAQRMRVLSEAVGRELSSASELNHTSDYDAVKRHLGTLADKLPAAMETKEDGDARRFMHRIRELLAELEELHPDPGAVVADLLRKITRARYGVKGLEDLRITPKVWKKNGRLIEERPELEKFLMTLNALIHGKDGLANNCTRAVVEHHRQQQEPELEAQPW